MELSDIENCRVCYETFDENLKPHCLPCGHSYCMGCLHNLLNGGNITCPKCMHVHRSVCADFFPINYDLEECISNYKKLQATSNCVIQRSVNCGTSVQSVDVDTMMQGIISDQKVNTKNLIQANKDLESGIMLYETFLTDEKAKHLELLQKIEELAKMNEVSVEQIDEELQRLPKMKNDTAGLRKQVEERLDSFEKADCLKSAMSAITDLYQPLIELEKWSKQCHQLLPNAKIITNSEKVLAETRIAISAVDFETPNAPGFPDLLEASLTIPQKIDKLRGNFTINLEKLRNMSQTNRNLLEETHVYAIHLENERARFAPVTFDNGSLYLHYLRDGKPPTSAKIIIKESELLESLDEDSVMVFMDLSWEGLKRGRILIKLFPGTFHGHQFRILCTGERGPSYAHSKFHGVTNKIGAYESVLAGNYDNQGGASIIQEFPVIHQSYRHPDVPGTVYTHYLNDASHSAQFVIQTGRGTGVTSDSAFGLVEIGLHILKQATKINDIRDVEITDCGLVLSL